MSKKVKKEITEIISESINEGVAVASEAITTIEKGVESTVRPIRKSVLQRFPILFSLLITFGVATVFFSFERILAETPLLNDRPWLMLGIGVLVLMATGVLYKKLGKYS